MNSDIEFIKSIAHLVNSKDIECRKLAISLIETRYPGKQKFTEFVTRRYINWITTFSDYFYDSFCIIEYIIEIFPKYDFEKIVVISSPPTSHLMFGNITLI